MKAVILAAGFGTRLRPHTHTGPKHLLPVANKPVLEHVLDKIREAGLKDAIMVVGHMEEFIKGYFGDGSKWGMNIQYVEQQKRLGIAHAVLLVEPLVKDEEFFVILGDNLFKMPLSKIIDLHKRSGAPASVALAKVADPQKFGVVELKNGEIASIEEKPARPKSNFAAIGLYFFSDTAVFDIIRRLKPSARGELEITDTLRSLLKEGFRVNPVMLEGYWKDTGLPEDLLDANRLVLDELGETANPKIENVTVRGAVLIGNNVTFRNEVILRGPLVIGNNCEINECVLGPYVTIGSNCKLLETVLSDTIVLDECDMKEAVLQHSILGKSCTVRPKAGKPRLIIGDHSHVEV